MANKRSCGGKVRKFVVLEDVDRIYLNYGKKVAFLNLLLYYMKHRNNFENQSINIGRDLNGKKV